MNGESDLLVDADAPRASSPDWRSALPTWARSKWLGHLLGLTACLFVAWQIGHDSNWDLFNYHLYNGLALLDGSFVDDIAPGGRQTYLNPLVDVPLAIGVRLVGLRPGVLISSAVLQYLCYLAIWRLAKEVVTSAGGTAMRWSLFGLAALGAGAVSLVFTTFADWIVAAVLCEGTRRLLIARRVQEEGGPPTRDYVIGSMIIGAAVGAKLTVAPFGIALLVALPLLARRMDVVRSALGMAAGFLLAAGPWMLYLQLRFGSPFFPFLNNIFRADSSPPESWDDARFGATGLVDMVAGPLRLARGSSAYGELFFRDWRLLGAVVVVAISVVLRGRASQFAVRRSSTYLAAVLVVAYPIWVFQFGYYRYFLFGEILASFLIVLVVFELVDGRRRASAACVALASVGLMFQAAPDWGHDLPLDSPPLTEATSAIRGDYTVAFLTGAPVGYLKASMSGEARLLYVFAFTAGEFRIDGAIGDELTDALESAVESGSLYAVSDPGAAPEVPYVPGGVLTDCVEFPARERQLQFCAVSVP